MHRGRARLVRGLRPESARWLSVVYSTSSQGEFLHRLRPSSRRSSREGHTNGAGEVAGALVEGAADTAKDTGGDADAATDAAAGVIDQVSENQHYVANATDAERYAQCKKRATSEFEGQVGLMKAALDDCLSRCSSAWFQRSTYLFPDLDQQEG